MCALDIVISVLGSIIGTFIYEAVRKGLARDRPKGCLKDDRVDLARRFRWLSAVFLSFFGLLAAFSVMRAFNIPVEDIVAAIIDRLLNFFR